MADFNRWVEAAAPALGWKTSYFTRVYRESRREAVKAQIAADPLASALAGISEFEGISRALLDLLRQWVEPADRWQGFPQSPKGLTTALKRLAPGLRVCGWIVEDVRIDPGRERGIRFRAPEAAGAASGAMGL